MFLDYFELTTQPFGVTPDPRFLYFGPKHQQALTALLYGTESNRGFLTLIAKPGMGKTSLLFHYLDGLRTKARTAFLFQTGGDATDLMRYLLADLGLDATGKDLPEMHAILNRVLIEEARAGRQFILVIDEAQNLDEEVLESVRLLSNFETPSAKLMQIILAGQSQLAERLARDSMSQLRQRISFAIGLEPLAREEVDTYIGHRLSVAGSKRSSPFTEAARLSIAKHSEGIPRNINSICFSAMSLAWALKLTTIDEELIRDVVTDLGVNVQANQAGALPTPYGIDSVIGRLRASALTPAPSSPGRLNDAPRSSS
jgi:general secretion pathway protein A